MVRGKWTIARAIGVSVTAVASFLGSAAANSPDEQGGEAVIVTARRTAEDLQDTPLAVTAINANALAASGATTIGKLDRLVPSVQFYSSNPRNSAVNIRGLGAPFGLTNDGIEQGVGLYVDGVYMARPAASTLDFIDIDQVEVLRGPQGTLYGKNTTAGAVNVTTLKPSATPETRLETSIGNLGYVQVRATTTGPLAKHLSGRVSLSRSERDGVIYNVRTRSDINDQDNFGVRGALLFEPSDTLAVNFSADLTRQRPNGYAQVFAGVAPTQRPLNRQYAAQAAFFNYAPPSFNAFDRITDLDTEHRSFQDLGGASLNVDWELGNGSLTSITAWRYWLWDPSNDRDFLGLPITTISQNPSKQYQWSQELRYAGDLSDSLSLVVGVFAFEQVVKTTGTQAQGSAAWRFLLNPNAQAATPGLLDGLRQDSDIRYKHVSGAVFGQLEWKATDRLRIIPGLRYNIDDKDGSYATVVTGGLATSNAALIALKNSVLQAQSYAATANDGNISGQLTIAYDISPDIHAYATYATAFKSVGLNINGLPRDAAGSVARALATVKPEDETHIEIGVKAEPFPGVTANFAAFRTTVDDFQANVVNGQVGVLRGYLANAQQVRVEGVEFDGRARVSDHLSLFANVAWTDGRYVRFVDAPPPLEESGGAVQVKDISGSRLPGLSKWAASYGAELSRPATLLGQSGETFFAVDASYRSSFSSSPSQSKFLNIERYSLFGARLGFRNDKGQSLYVWGRNLTDEDYFELLTAGASSSGYYAGLPGDPRTFGVTLVTRF